MRILILLAAVYLLTPMAYNRLAPPQTYGEFWPDGSPKISRATRRTLDGVIKNHGIYQSYYQSGAIETQGTYKDGRREGEWIWLFESGKMKARCVYHEDAGLFEAFHETGGLKRRGRMELTTRQGLWVEWFANGDLRMRGKMVDGVQHGRWTYWPESAPTDSLHVIWDHGERLN
jgi:hypothetical protein